MENEEFRIIAIRPITPFSLEEDSKEMRQVRSIQKAVFGKGWLYFYKGYEFKDLDITHVNRSETRRYGYNLLISSEEHLDEMLYSTSKLNISISAIVGENGSGKSSAVELMIRLINNFAAAVMGEEIRNEASEHLFFIENVYGCLAFQQGSKYYQLKVEGRSVILSEYFYNNELRCYELPHADKQLQLLDDEEIRDRHKPIRKKKIESEKLKQLFYTVIYNYSMYAFNYNDYEIEQTVENRWKSRKKNKFSQDCVWLKGLFHKNDGYQTPIVLNPMRDNGLIDIPKENTLTKERLLSMLFYTDNEESGKFPFRTINRDKEIVGLKIRYYESPNYSKTKVINHLKLGKSRISDDFNKVREAIVDKWCAVAGLTHDESRTDNELAWDYIVYKTLKISKNYKRFNKINRNLREEFKDSLLEKHLHELYEDKSHVTKKLKRAIFFLKTSIFRNTGETIFWLKEIEQSMKNADIQWKSVLKENEEESDGMYIHDELLPPPIYDISLLIIEKNNINKNGKFDEKDTFPFDGLSSGEKQIAGVISNFVYHLVNINSVWKTNNSVVENKDEEVVKYRYVNVVFDEVELYFHPDLQRRFMKIMIDSLHQITIEHIKGINIQIVTHSPFVLSDLPSTNVLFLQKKGKDKEHNETFAANIHKMIGSSFFMDYAIGDVARETIQEVFEIYHLAKESNNEEEIKRNKCRWIGKEDFFLYVGSVISDDYLRNTYQIMVKELMRIYKTKVFIKEEKRQLMERLKELEKWSDD